MKILRKIVWSIVLVTAWASGTLLSAQQGSVSTDGVGTAGVHIESFGLYPDVTIKTGNDTASTFRIFNAANAELLRVSANGNVGIGTTNPTDKLVVFNGTTNGAVVISTPLDGGFAVNSPIGGLRLAWKVAGAASNNVDLQVVRGWDALDGAGLAIFTSPSNASTVERMRITSAGRVGIGASAPAARLMVFNDTNGIPAVHAQQQSISSANGISYEVAVNGQTRSVISAGLTNSGVGMGLVGLSNLEGAGTLATAHALYAEAGVTAGNTGTITTANGVYARVAQNGGSIINGHGVFIADVAATNDYGIYQAGSDDSNFFAGDVTIGAAGATGTKLSVNGDVSVSGTITGAKVLGATYQDLAEWVPATSDMKPGTVVVLNQERMNEVMPSHRAYDTSVAGVVSEQPGIILGIADASKEPIATTGRVKVLVDATRASVQIGDLLVTSDKPGMAMRSEPMDIGGRKFHQPGTIVGKALQPLASGEGEILVLLSLQ